MSDNITSFAESQAYARHHRDEDFWTPPPAAPAAAVPIAYDFHETLPQTTVVPIKSKGRHKFTREECQRGFWAAIESIVTRYPDAIMPDGRHIACNFLKAKNPQFFLDRQQKRAA